jgi:hypothetical protein
MDGEHNAHQQLRRGMYRLSFFVFLFLFSIPFFSFPENDPEHSGPSTVQEVREALELEKATIGNVTFGVNVSHVCIRIVISWVTEALLLTAFSLALFTIAFAYLHQHSSTTTLYHCAPRNWRPLLSQHYFYIQRYVTLENIGQAAALCRFGGRDGYS